MKCRVIILVLGFLLTLLPVTGAAAAETMQLSRLVFNGQQNVDPDTLYRYVPLQAGERYTGAQLAEGCQLAIRQLYATKLFSDIKVDWDSPDEQTVIVTFLVAENPIVRKLTIDGIAEMDSDKVLRAILIHEGQPLEPYAVKVTETNLRALYNEDGFFNIKVEITTELDPATNTVAVRVAIEESSKIKVADITIEYTEPLGLWGGLVDRWQRSWSLETTAGKGYNAETLDKDIAAIMRDLRGEGYWGAKVEPILDFNEAHTRVTIVLRITRGQLFYLQEIQVAGNTVIPTADLLADVSFKPEMIFKEKYIYETLLQLRAKYEAQGYANVLVQPQYTPAPDNRFVLKLDITEGEVFYIGEIRILGVIKTLDKLIRRELKFHTGDRYDGTRVKMSERNLNNLGFFENIRIEFKPGRAPNVKDVYVTMTEAKTGMLSIGMAYSKLDHIMGLLEIKKRNFAFDDLWSFTGRGQELNARVEYGGRRQNFNISWSDPWINDNLDDTHTPSPLVPVFLGLSGFNMVHEWDGYDEGHLGGGIKLGRPIYDDYTYGFISYKWDRIDIDDIDPWSAPTNIIAAGAQHDRASSMSFDVVRETLDNRWEPHTGYRLALSNTATGGWLGGTIDYNRPSVDFSYMIPTTEKTAFAFHTMWSMIDNPFSAQEVPSYELFYLGGGESVRGYPDRSLALYPGYNGGHTAMYFNLEWRYPIVQNMLSGLFFLDGGNVFGPPGEVVFGDFKYGIGLGFRLKLMGMPLRIDYGYRLQESQPGASDGHQGELHFSFGSMF